MVARFFQLLGEHTMVAPFLGEKWGWTDTDICWWCGRGRQSRGHLFIECTAWTKEIREMWAAVGEASRECSDVRDRFKSRKGCGLRVRQARARPSNTSIRDLLSDNRCTEAVLVFLGAKTVGEVKEGAICT